MRRYEINESQWEEIRNLFPSRRTGKGRPCRSHFQIFNGILWLLFSGAAWRDVPERYGPWQTVYDVFRRWQKDGTLEKVFLRLQLKLDENGLLDYSTWFVDSTTARAHKSAAGGRKKKRGGNRRITD